MKSTDRASSRRRRRNATLFAIGMLAAALSPAACNVFVSLARCSSNDDCPTHYTCDMTGRFCVVDPPEPSAQPDARADADASSDADAGVSFDAAPDADAAPLPPPCDGTAPYGSLTPVAGLDPTLTSARFSDNELTVTYSASPSCGAESCADLFFARRTDLDASFGGGDGLPGQNISVANASEYWPTITQDGLLLYFESGRSLSPLADGGYYTDQSRIWTASRTNKQLDFDAPHVESAFLGIAGPEGSPYIHPNGTSVYFTSAGRGGKGALDIFVAALDPDFGFRPTTVTNVAAINTVADESAPVVTLNQKTLYFARDDAGYRRIWRSTRSDPAGEFGAPALVAELNSPIPQVEEFPSWVSLDECRIYVVSNRPLAADTGDAATQPGPFRLWVASRPK